MGETMNASSAPTASISNESSDESRHDDGHGRLHGAGTGVAEKSWTRVATFSRLAVVLYEMATGRPAFSGTTSGGDF